MAKATSNRCSSSGADILFSVPWSCGDGDCPVGWHEATYWLEWEGKKNSYTVDRYTDGDHESIDVLSDLPCRMEQEKAWADYYKYVAASGKDPLKQFMLPQRPPKCHQWQARFQANKRLDEGDGLRFLLALAVHLSWKIYMNPATFYIE